MDSVGAYEAKTHLPRLLRRVMEGESVTITKHGRPIARLVPVEEDERTRAYEAARRIRESRSRLKNKASLEELLETIHEGHRY
ncbi:type II toxin-antitoxin system Phd/YefM family antitoxin [Candidatus Palauibacter sp.]|uniref:type II toxin-antitoxin system Phd/YefM family antitoxin n=1 Tax=Candidatus Palauibacter sp. TaxID=3101350 RepID=UPI003B52EB33